MIIYDFDYPEAFHCIISDRINDIKCISRACVISKGLSLSEKDFLLTDSDSGIIRGRELGIPIIAWRHMTNSSQSLMNTSYLILSPDALEKEFLEEIAARYYGEPLIIGKTDRLLIRELTNSDLPNLLVLHESLKNHPDGQFFPPNCPDPASFLSYYISHQYPFFGFGIYGLFDLNSHRLIGIAGYSETEDPSTGNLSYAINPDYQRQGYATEAIRCLYPLGSQRFGFEKVMAYIDKKNTASLRLAEKCGIPVSIINH